eukprot:842811_1
MLDKAFDKVNRNGIIIKLDNINISGKNLRLLINELNNSDFIIKYNGINSILIKIDDGTPQGHTESGPIFNIYMNSSLKKCLSIVHTYVYNVNVSAWYYADDGLKIALSYDDMQILI